MIMTQDDIFQFYFVFLLTLLTIQIVTKGDGSFAVLGLISSGSRADRSPHAFLTCACLCGQFHLAVVNSLLLLLFDAMSS